MLRSLYSAWCGLSGAGPAWVNPRLGDGAAAETDPRDLRAESGERPASDQPDRTERRRGWRVVALTAVIAVLSVLDLRLTLAFLKTGGMSEGNPIARWIISHNCEWLLTIFKLGLVGLTCIILIVLRQRRAAELGAWIGFGVMAWLMVQWELYAEQATQLTVMMAEAERLADLKIVNWVTLQP